MDVHLHLTRETACGQLVLACNSGDHRDRRIELRFDEIAPRIGSPEDVPAYQTALKEEFTWKGYYNIDLRLIPQA